MAFVGRSDVKDPGSQQDQWERLARRRERLYAEDAQFIATRPDERIAAAARTPRLRIGEVMATVLRGYADRPALGQRVREVATDPATGRSTLNYRPRFETAMGALPERQRAQSVLTVLDVYREPMLAIAGSPVPGAQFQSAVEHSGRAIPHVSQQLIEKYLADLAQIGVLAR